MDSGPPVFCTVADRAYFLGAVALVNSLRLTEHAQEIALLDVGLDDRQRAFLDREATIHEGPAGVGWLSVFVKPLFADLYPDRSLVLIDNDVVVTRSLQPLLDAAAEGKIAAFVQADSSRWFAEWETLFRLREPLRHGSYVNGGCVALSSARWRPFLDRWRELGESVAGDRAARPFLVPQQEARADPVGYNEQDTLNALLMSEVPESAVELWSHLLAPSWEERDEVHVVDATSLRCWVDGEEPFFLHATGQPKPWQPKGWLRLRFDAFSELLRRVLTGDDVALRVPSAWLPPWIRDDARGRLLDASGAAAARALRASSAVLPEPVRARLVAPIRARFSRTGARAEK